MIDVFRIIALTPVLAMICNMCSDTVFAVVCGQTARRESEERHPGERECTDSRERVRRDSRERESGEPIRRESAQTARRESSERPREERQPGERAYRQLEERERV